MSIACACSALPLPRLHVLALTSSLDPSPRSHLPFVGDSRIAPIPKLPRPNFRQLSNLCCRMSDLFNFP